MTQTMTDEDSFPVQAQPEEPPKVVDPSPEIEEHAQAPEKRPTPEEMSEILLEAEDARDLMGTSTLQPSKTTDQANADRMVASYGDKILYCTRWGRWLIWDDHRFRIDFENQIRVIARNTAREIYNEAMAAPSLTTKRKIAKWAVASESQQKQDMMIKATQALKPVKPEELDQNIWLINLSENTMELRKELPE